jgi:hypothetical protein
MSCVGARCSASDIAVFIGAYAQVSPLGALVALRVVAFEFCLAVWPGIKGFFQGGRRLVVALRQGTCSTAGPRA